MENFAWLRDYQALRRFVEEKDKDRKFSFAGDDKDRFERLRDSLREKFVKSVVGEELREARKWISVFSSELDDLIAKLRLQGTELSREFKSFLDDPLRHLMKKITFYLYDLLRDKISLEEFVSSAGAAVRASLKTNMRTLYQSWVYVALLRLLSDMGGNLIYPEVRVLSLGRSGKQTTGTIPPNAIMWFPGKGYISFFLEAPRPIAWEDSLDLKRIWNLYVTLRPDMLVYSGRVLNIVELDKNPPVKRPNVIIECKELKDWYKRVREVRGPFAKPLSVEEWRSKWIEGLWDGLADIIGVTRKKQETVRKKKAVRMKDYQIVVLYRALFKPDAMFLVSRASVPAEIKAELENKGIIVFDDVGFRRERLKELTEELLSFVRRSSSDTELLELDEEASKLIDELEEILGVRDRLKIVKIALRNMLNNVQK